MTFAAIFAIAVGILMIVQWLISYLTHQIAELATEPYRIWFHIAGEMATACALIIGGTGLLMEQPWSAWLYPFALGMLVYTVIVSPGYFAQKGNWKFVGMFGLILLLAIVSISGFAL